MKLNEMPSAAELRDIIRIKGRRCISVKADSPGICRGLMVTRLSVNDAAGYMIGGPGGRTDAVGALYGTGLLTPSLFDGNIDADVFSAWIGRDSLPKLPENSVIVMDNASFHKRRDIREAITSAGHPIDYPPVYSPDPNPIEHKRAQAEALRRKQRCSLDELFRDHKLQSFYCAPAISESCSFSF